MVTPQVVVVSLRGSGTQLLAQATTTLGYTPYGTMGGTQSAQGDRPGPGEVHPLLMAAYGPDRTHRLLQDQHVDRAALEAAFQEAVTALWRIWWLRLGQPVSLGSPVDPHLEGRLARVPDADLIRLLPGRGCWYVNALDLQRADGGFLRAWHATGRPALVLHHRDVRDRIISQIKLLSQPADRVGTQPEHLIYRDIVTALPTLEERITLALTDPDFPGMREARHSQWLLHHPAVQVIAHEDLAGPDHGGTDEGRTAALTTLLNAVGHPDHRAALAALTPAPPPCDAEDLSVGTWRTRFTPHHERLLRQHHGDLLPAGPSQVPGQGSGPEPTPDESAPHDRRLRTGTSHGGRMAGR
ncbi:hypothetical protein ACFQ61_34640 [Streptomyces sp. NPDC056500]|uniref:hypothetical protein n=1 Tax=Streptomyces sp. NPDC056500 TaxID=3345840 RepID=UPI003698BCEE